MTRRRLLVIAAAAALLGGVIYLNTPPVLVNAALAPELPDDIESWLADRERQAATQYALIPETEKRVTWYGEPGERTAYAVVNLHGFSATRQETAPLAERVATALAANLFETRLSGHGHEERPMHGVRAEDWLEDTAEAFAIGARLGKKIVVIGTSTGGTLALAMSDHETAAAVSDIVLISPNLRPKDNKAAWLTWPAGPLFAKLINGETRSWEPHNELQARFWSTSYPIEAAVEVMRLVNSVRSRLPMQLEQNLLVLQSPDDAVVSPEATRRAFERISAPRKRLIEIEYAQDPSNHVLAGDILSPANTGKIAAEIATFVAER
ncbi:MAG TPA: alpha/beta fold hydrolase [Woeseiaceae bacterium]|nr:alpha/beta fold hydrolase [Woeseiaceae bacterium]